MRNYLILNIQRAIVLGVSLIIAEPVLAGEPEIQEVVVPDRKTIKLPNGITKIEYRVGKARVDTTNREVVGYCPRDWILISGSCTSELGHPEFKFTHSQIMFDGDVRMGWYCRAEELASIPPPPGYIRFEVQLVCGKTN